MFRKIATGALLLCMTSSVFAYGSSDVSCEVASELSKYKVKGTNAQGQFTAISAYFITGIIDPQALKKSKATGYYRFYLSDNTTLSDDDTLVAVKKFSLKAFIPKFVKIKVNLTASDRGRYLLSVVECEQDNYAANDVDSFYIPYNAF